MVRFAVYAHIHPATLGSIGANADENKRDFFFPGTPFAKHQVAIVARHVWILPGACRATTQKVLVAKVAQHYELEGAATAQAVRVFATLALSALTYDTTADRARAEIEGSLQ